MLCFALSAIEPALHAAALGNLAAALRPGLRVFTRPVVIPVQLLLLALLQDLRAADWEKERASAPE